MPPRRSGTTAPPPEEFEENIVDIDVTEEMRGSYLEYAYSVIYSRALPDARDGLKPVQRRILYLMQDMGLRPDRPHVKCAQVVGAVMGRLHPHGDTAIYDSLVRMAQPWAMRVPLIDGHGNFGSLGGDDSPAAYRYTECRLTEAAMAMVASIDEDTVDFVPNYDGSEQQPDVLPAGFPNLLVNGTAGIAVGMATNMAPHNLTEVIAAARYLLKHPDASTEQLMKYVPGPDLPTGGHIVGLDGIREAYQTGRGIFRTRATVKIEQLNARKTGIVVTELPYSVGPEKVVARIKDLVQAKKLVGISDLKDLTDRNRGLNLVIEVRAGFNPEAVLAELYRLTPMEETFGINNVALVDGQPRTLGLRELLTIYVDHRLDVTRRRSEFRRRKRQERLHLVDGILIALLNIDEVIQVIRTSDDSAEAKTPPAAGVRPVRDPGAVHPRHPAAPPDQVRQARAGARAGDPAGRDRRADRDPGERRDAPRPGRRRDGRPRQEVRHPPPHGADGGGRGSHRRRPARGRRRPVPGGAVGDRPAGPHPAAKIKIRMSNGPWSHPGRQHPPAPGTSSPPRSPPPPAAASARSPRPAG